jgi:hypothetical protein
MLGRRTVNKNKINFGLDIALVALFTLTTISLFGEGGRNELASTAAQPVNLLHCLSGMLMVVCSVVHLLLHWDWIRAVILRRSTNLPNRVRTNRTIDVCLLGFLVVVGLSGLVSWAFPSLREWAALHRLSGTLMLVVIGVHGVYHWKWMVVNAKRYLGLRVSRRAV